MVFVFKRTFFLV